MSAENKLPFLMVGQTHAGAYAPAWVFLLGQPVYCLSSPPAWAAKHTTADITPLVNLQVGNSNHLRILNQWQQGLAEWSGHPGRALAHFMITPEDSWHSLKAQIKGLTGTELHALDRDVLLFLLLARLDEARSEQKAIERGYQAALNKLQANLDQPCVADNLSDPPDESEEECLRRLNIWSRVAASMDLPKTIWAWPTGLFENWRQSWPEAFHNLQPACIVNFSEDNHRIDDLWKYLYGFWESSGVDNYAQAAKILRNAWTDNGGNQLNLYWLPPTLMQSLSGQLQGCLSIVG